MVFDAYSHSTDLNRLAWGESYFDKKKVTAIHVLGRTNDWYQFDGTLDALEVVREAVRGADRVMTYGVSMGAYAAVRFAPRIGAHVALALSPQYSIDPGRAPFDNRWAHDAARIRFREELDGPISSEASTIVVYDPHSKDGHHARRIAEDIAITHLRLPYVDHSAPMMLNEAGLLQPIVERALEGTLDTREFEQKFRAARNRLSSYHSELATHQPAWRKKTAIALAERAVSLNPRHNIPMHGLAQIHAAAGEHHEAVRWYEKILENGSRYLELLLMLSQSLWEVGDKERALSFAEELTQKYPAYEHGIYWHATLLIRMGKADEAIEYLEIKVSKNATFSNCRALLDYAKAERLKPKHKVFIDRLARRLRKQIRKLKAAGTNVLRR